MAKAPRPGVGSRKDVTARAQQILVVRVGGEEWRFAWLNLPLSERMLVRKWTGLPYANFIGGEAIDQDSLALLWCLARRAAGEKDLVFNDALSTTWDALIEAAAGDFDMTVEDPDDTEAEDPEV